MEKYKIKIEIVGTRTGLFLLDKKNRVVDELIWIDNRDFAEKILENIDELFKRNEISIKDIEKAIFNCDSPYYKKKKKEFYSLEAENSKGKCGFTTWQMGEIAAKTLNFFLKNK